eukprot:Colp12_sorted_trinity150504_noHs@22842
MNQVTESLFISSASVVNDHTLLRERNITTIVRLNYYDYMSLYTPPKDIKVHAFEFEDSNREDETRFRQAIESCHQVVAQTAEAGGRTLVHCQQGICRSAAAVVYHLMKSRAWSFKDAYAHLTRARLIVDINDHFTNILLQIERESKQ